MQVENYHPEVIWSDGEWEATDEYWTSKEFIAWLYNESPVKDTVVVNDRWGKGDVGKHGDYYTYADRYNPGKIPHIIFFDYSSCSSSHLTENIIPLPFEKSSHIFRSAPVT